MADTKIYRVTLKEGAGPRARLVMQSGMVAVFDNRADPKVARGARAVHFIRMTDVEAAEKRSEGVYDIVESSEVEAAQAATAHQKSYAKPAGSQMKVKGKTPTEPGGVADLKLDPADVQNPLKMSAAAKA